MCASKRTAAILRPARPQGRQRFLCGLSRLHSTETDLSRACWMGRPIGGHLSTVFCDRPRLLVLLLDIFEIPQRSDCTLLEPAKKRPIDLLRHSSPCPDDPALAGPSGLFLSDRRSPALRSMRHFTVQSAMSASRRSATFNMSAAAELCGVATIQPTSAIRARSSKAVGPHPANSGLSHHTWRSGLNSARNSESECE